jgi:hypothetical protein
MKKTFALIIIVLLFVSLFTGITAQADEKYKLKSVTVTCLNASSPDINPTDTLVNIYAYDGVIYQVNISSFCLTGVKVVGSAPIGTFFLNSAAPNKTIIFPNTGSFTYIVTDSIADADTAYGRVVVTLGAPTLTQWGVIILVTLLILSAIYIMLKRRKATVPA